MPSTTSTVTPSGSSNVGRNHFGVAPVAAMSLAFTLTAYQPIRSVANVTGSAFAIRLVAPKEMTAASSPTPGPVSSLRPGSGSRDRSSLSIAAGSFPAGRPVRLAEERTELAESESGAVR